MVAAYWWTHTVTAQVGWISFRAGGHPVLSVHLSYELGDSCSGNWHDSSIDMARD